MRNAVKSCLATDAAKQAPHQELINYLELQLLKSAYCKGHISAAGEAELAVPRAHSPIILG